MFLTPKNIEEILANLKEIAKNKTGEVHNPAIVNRMFAVALAFLLNELVPPDRTTNYAFRKERLPQ